MKSRFLAFAFLATLLQSAYAEPPLTKKERLESATDAGNQFMEQMAEAFEELRESSKTKLKVKPKIVATVDTDPTLKRKGHGLNVDVMLANDKKLGARLICNVRGDAMAIERITFVLPYHRDEAHKSREQSLDIVEDSLNAWMRSAGKDEDHIKSVLKEWETARIPLFKVGGLISYERDGVTYAFQTIPETRDQRSAFHLTIQPFGT